MVDIELYRYSLVAALSLMIYFSLTFIFGRLPEGNYFLHYGKARRRLGLALLMLSVNYAVHLFTTPRFCCPDWAILMNIDTYFIAAWLFASSMQELLTRDYNSPRRDVLNTIGWAAFCAAGATLTILSPSAAMTTATLLAMSLVFMLYTLHLAISLIGAYRRAVRLLDGYHSDDIAAYVKWMSVFTWLAVFYGIGQGVFTFLPDKYVFVWILSSIPFYAYGYVSYVNYSLDVRKVDEALDTDTTDTADCNTQFSAADTDAASDTTIGERLARWIAEEGFTCKGLTITQLAHDICTNRTYLSVYINTNYGMSFRDWVNSLRLNFAKRLLADKPTLNISDIAERSGYVSLSSFTRIFSTTEGTSPGRWRREHTCKQPSGNASTT